MPEAAAAQISGACAGRVRKGFVVNKSWPPGNRYADAPAASGGRHTFSSGKFILVRFRPENIDVHRPYFVLLP